MSTRYFQILAADVLQIVLHLHTRTVLLLGGGRGICGILGPMTVCRTLDLNILNLDLNILSQNLSVYPIYKGIQTK